MSAGHYRRLGYIGLWTAVAGYAGVVIASVTALAVGQAALVIFALGAVIAIFGMAMANLKDRS